MDTIHRLLIIHQGQVVNPAHILKARRHLVAHHLEIKVLHRVVVGYVVLNSDLRPRARHRKHAPGNLLCLLLRPPARGPDFPELFERAEPQADTIACAVPLCALQDVGAGREVG